MKKLILAFLFLVLFTSMVHAQFIFDGPGAAISAAPSPGFVGTSNAAGGTDGCYGGTDFKRFHHNRYAFTATAGQVQVAHFKSASNDAHAVYSNVIDASGNILACCSKASVTTGWGRCKAASPITLTATSYYVGFATAGYSINMYLETSTAHALNYNSATTTPNCTDPASFSLPGSSVNANAYTVYWDNTDADPS